MTKTYDRGWRIAIRKGMLATGIYATLTIVNAITGRRLDPDDNKLGRYYDPSAAYAFFDCSAPEEEITEELSTLRKVTNVPRRLKIKLTRGIDGLEGCLNLDPIKEEAKKFGIRFAMKATCPGMTSRDSANELATILNQAYQSPPYKEGEHFRGGIVFRKGREYVFRE